MGAPSRQAAIGFASLANVLLDVPVTATMLDQLCPLPSIFMIPALRRSSSCRPPWRPSVCALASLAPVGGDGRCSPTYGSGENV